jgi:hypothetical protein
MSLKICAAFGKLYPAITMFQLFLRSVACHSSARTSYDSILQLDGTAPIKRKAIQRQEEEVFKFKAHPRF